ncbi:TIGR03905 family TSCPD domain-containing protein [Desulfoluna sp.]|uniref:TIGR03905 family TSCPD domain-containing protein n=1 Tax=Desulfoluna sp. TaxID=2045199 RepID=UPI00262D6995|nr:TIGR03905 family TSCPD domain-containing protein [Desulfoluna sp.]
MYTYQPQGVCAKKIDFQIEEGTVKNLVFTNGCPGNLEGIQRLVEGMPVEDVIARLKGITCGKKATSCPDQLCLALEAWQQGELQIATGASHLKLVI